MHRLQWQVLCWKCTQYPTHNLPNYEALESLFASLRWRISFQLTDQAFGHTRGTRGRLLVSNIEEMSRVQKVGVMFVALMFIGLFMHELIHFRRSGHLAPFGLHADVSMTASSDVLGVEGVAKIYRARLTNYGIFPSTITVCAERVAGVPEIEVNYLVERWDSQSSDWRVVPEWDFSGYRLFCTPVFEVSEQHLVKWRLWPGQSIEIGEGIPAQLGGFHIGDDGRFTVFLNADGNKANAISTAIFHVDQEVKKRHASSHDYCANRARE